jgi:DNA-binding CsgD family transcriptional regulator
MTLTIDNLTDKEKQTLRLLARGYDAKSAARQLGLSVHTVNERLRSARQKLAVSSSREAARKLSDSEGDTPQFLGDKPLGGAPGVPLIPDRPQPAAAISRILFSGWAKGVMLMSIAFAIAAFAALSGQSDRPVATVASEAARPAETDAVRAARAWLALVDAGDWQRSWEGTAPSFQALNSRERWAEVAASVQGPLGRPIGHDLISETFVPTPPAGYQLIKFRSRYANKAETLISISLEQHGTGWKVAGIMLD